MSEIREEYLDLKKLIRGKDKCETFLRQREFNLKVKTRRNYHTTPASTMEIILPHVYNEISNDVWYHVSKYIEPEDIQLFALICTQTAALVRTKSFWKHIYRNYCQKFGTQIWILHLPAHLQYDNICNYSPQLFRMNIIEALFYCYEPFANRTKNYSLDILIGRSFISAWHKLWENCIWIMCYQFRQFGLPFRNVTEKFPDEFKPPTNEELVNDWESLMSCDDENDDDTLLTSNNALKVPGHEDVNPYEGVCLLVIFGQRFIPVPSNLTYGNETAQGSSLRLAATRRPLTSDLRDYNLELDFIDTINKTTITVKYPTVKHKVLPWWHPDFKKYAQYDACDKFS